MTIMLAQFFLSVEAFVFSFMFHSTNAAPGLNPRSMSYLNKRSNTLLGCDDEQTAKVVQALADMSSLASNAFDTASTDSRGFSHYFHDSELDVFKSAMSIIAGNRDPMDAPYSFIVNCNPTDDVLPSCNQSYAITDATVSEDDHDFKSIWLCPLFFTGDDSKNHLPSADDQDQLDQWCNQDSYKKLLTAGHIILHKMMHLDAVARLFPLDANPDLQDQHGTVDYVFGSSPIEWATRLKLAIDNEPGRANLPAASFVAENYAGAATELWAKQFCPKGFVPSQNRN